MQKEGIDILTIGGFDPSNGAGITADIKTFEALDQPAIAVQTCLTIQNESEVSRIYWFTEEQIREQLDILFKRHHPRFVKLSLAQDLASAASIVRYLKRKLTDVMIIWDPVMTSSSGFDFYDDINSTTLKEILSGIYIATPNWKEIEKWSDLDPQMAAAEFSEFTWLILKGGHRPDAKGTDILFKGGKRIKQFAPGRQLSCSKHGSGCVFASALTAYLSEGKDIKAAIQGAKSYIEDFLSSAPGTLGIHRKNTITVEHG